MSRQDSTAPAASDKPTKPSKPYPDFPLFPHAAGVWAKKIRGKMHYFGPWTDPDSALAKYLEQKDALHAGRKPRPDPEALVVNELFNAFLGAKQALVDAGELAPLTWGDYKTACDEIIAAFGKTRLDRLPPAEDRHPPALPTLAGNRGRPPRRLDKAARSEEARPRLCVVRTPRPGFHVRYRCTETPIPGNTKLAVDPTLPSDQRRLIETRGQGGYASRPDALPNATKPENFMSLSRGWRWPMCKRSRRPSPSRCGEARPRPAFLSPVENLASLGRPPLGGGPDGGRDTAC
jgi:hypothetical protein